jgi:PAS domain S-box-containing protein
MSGTSRARLVAYGTAVLATGPSLVLRLSLDPWLGTYAPHMTFFPAVILSAYLGGLGPGLLATVLGAASGAYFLFGPNFSLASGEPGEVYALGLFVLAGAVISGLTESLHRSHHRVAASERRYAVTLGSIGDAVIATDTRARVTFLNPAAEALTGWPAAAAIGHPLTEVFRIVNERTREPAEDPAARVLRTGTVAGLANHAALLARDGRETPIDDCGAPIIDDRGTIAGVVLVFRDVTQRRRAEEAEAVRRVNERINLALRGSNVGVYEHEMPDGDPDRPRHYVNMWELLGYEGPPPGREAIIDLVGPEDRDRAAELLRRATTGAGTEYELEFRAPHRDGSERILLARGTAVRDATGKPIRFVGTHIDITGLRRAEEALRDSEQRWRGLTEALPQLVWSAGPDGSCDYFSTQWTAHTGVAEPELLGWQWLETLHPEDRAPTRAFWLGSVAGRHAYDVEYRVRRRDGEYRWFKTRGVPIRDSGGHIVKWFGTCTDITDLRQTEEALRESEERFRGTFENAAVGIANVDPTGRFVRVNEKYCAIVGYTRDELIQKTVQDVTHPDDLEASLPPLWAVLRGESPDFAIEKRYLRKDGSVVWVELFASLQRDPAGKPAYSISVIQDISDRKRLDAELREAQEAEAERARLAELGRDVGIALSQGNTLCELLQPCAEAMVRYLDAALARVWCLPPDGAVLELQASAGMYTHLDGAHARIPLGRFKIGRIAQERQPVLTNEAQTDPCISDPDWARREGLVAFVGYPLMVNDRLLGVLGVFSRNPLSGAVLQALESVAGVIALGIERKQQDAELRQARDVAEAANRAKDEFLANVSHEIRTPMGAILGMTELTLDTELTDDQRQYLTTVKVAADNLLGIINDLLDFAKIEAGKMELDPADFSLRAVVAGTLRALAVRAHNKGIELIHQVRPDVPDALVGDAGRLRQVLLNLIGNAIKFTGTGEVEVSAEIAEDPAPEMVGLRFAVRDTGIGIPKDQQQRIFRAFEQEDTSTTRRYGGTGLGLTIAARLAALMGGTITVDSAPGRGSTFAFTARFGRQPAPVGRVPTRHPDLLRDRSVLVVDDNATNRHILAEWLRGWQMRPAAVGDAPAALDALRQASSDGRPYPLVLLDARMPDVDGMTLAEQIRRDPAMFATRIILLTSGDRPGDMTRARELRIAHLLKPVQPDELHLAICNVLDRADGAAPPTEPPATDRGAGPAPVPSDVSLRILVAEDNAFNALLLEQLLGRRGHRVRVATNGREALALLGISSPQTGDPSSLTSDLCPRTSAFDLLLLDIHMPELDGFQVVSAVRACEQLTGGHLPVVALTARSRKETRAQCLAAGMDDYLAKPIRAADLWATIDRIGAARGQRSEVKGQKTEVSEEKTDGAAPPGSGLRALASEEGLLDPRAVLAACGGDGTILERIGRAFRAGLPGQLEAVRSAVRAGDTVRLREAAHRLCGMVGAFSTVAGGVASSIEDLAASGRLDETRPLVERLEAMARELIAAIDGLSVEALRQWVVGR